MRRASTSSISQMTVYYGTISICNHLHVHFNTRWRTFHLRKAPGGGRVLLPPPSSGHLLTHIVYKDNSVILSAEKQSLQKWAWFKCFWFCRNSSLQYLKMLTFLRWTGHRRIAFISAFSDNIVLRKRNETKRKRKRKRLNFSRLTWISKLLMFRRILAFYRAKTKYMDWNNLFVSVS